MVQQLDIPTPPTDMPTLLEEYKSFTGELDYGPELLRVLDGAEDTEILEQLVVTEAADDLRGCLPSEEQRAEAASLVRQAFRMGFTAEADTTSLTVEGLAKFMQQAVSDRERSTWHANSLTVARRIAFLEGQPAVLASAEIVFAIGRGLGTDTGN